MLKGMKNVEIVGLMAYENRHGIAYIMGLYSNGKHTSSFLPYNYLEKGCKSKKMVLNDPKDQIKWIKVFHKKEENSVVRLEIYSHNKIKFEAGLKK